MTHERFDEIIAVMLARWGESAMDSAPPKNIRNICERMLCTALHEINRDLDKHFEIQEERGVSGHTVVLAINSPEP